MSRHHIRRAAFTTILLLGINGPGVSQTRSDPQSTDPVHPLGDSRRNEDPFAGKMAEQQARNRNIERQKKLVTDTDKLLSLATELKQEVDRSDKNTLSLDVVKKADEIEKLAHSVKEKMKGGM